MHVILLCLATALAPPLTLDDAVRLFRTSAFDVLIANASVESARADELITAGLPNPSIGISQGSYRAFSANLTDSAVSDIVSGRRRLRSEVARAVTGVTAATRDDLRRNLEFTLKQQMLQAELAKKSLDFARRSQALTNETFDLVSRRYKAGAVSEADVARADVQRLEAEQAVDAATQTFGIARAQLAYLLARSEPVDVGDDLLRPAEIAPSRDDLYRGALAHRPDLAAARLQVERAQSSIELARRMRIPAFSPTLQYTRQGGGPNPIQPPTVTLGIAAPLPLLYRYRGEEAKAEADLRAQEIAQRKIEAQVAADVDASLAAYISASERVNRMRSRLLPQAARARDLVKLQYEKGAASLFEFLDAQRAYVAAQTEFLQNLNDDWIAVFQMEQATGMELHR